MAIRQFLKTSEAIWFVLSKYSHLEKKMAKEEINKINHSEVLH